MNFNIPGTNIVNHYMYLGSQICDNGTFVSEIKRRMGMAKDVMTSLNNIWKKRGIGIKTKIRLIRALIFSILLCGVETWTILAWERHWVDALEMWYWPRMLRIPRTTRRTNADSNPTPNKNSFVDHMPSADSLNETWKSDCRRGQGQKITRLINQQVGPIK